MKKTDYRVERDSIGVKDIPEDVYYGVQSLRAAENFHITGLNMHPEIINSLAYIKKAAAITNCEVGLLEKKKAQAIVQACDEIVSGKFHNEFIVDPVQGGAGTSLNMNANEVIANRAIEILGGKKGDYTIINPRFSAFFQTELDLILRSLGVKTVILKGTTTPNCIRTSCYDGLSLDYHILIIEDCCSSNTAEIQRVNMEDMARVGAVITDSDTFCTDVFAVADFAGEIQRRVQQDETAPE